MLKLIYAAGLVLLSSAAFLFSKEKETFNCDNTLSGTIRELKDEQGFFLYIEAADKKTYFPLIDNEDVVLASGAKVKICYSKTTSTSHGHPVIRINHVSYLP
jgi:hypothetical protein